MEDFGPTYEVDAEAIGQPGQRTFRFLAHGAGGYASLWMEKEQLKALGDAARQICAQLDEAQANGSDGEMGIPVFPAGPQVEFQVGKLAIGFDQTKDLLVVLAHSVEAVDRDEPDFACAMNRRQSLALAEKIDQLYVSGRPICPLCAQPMDPSGHACARANGHKPELDRHLKLDDEEEAG